MWKYLDNIYVKYVLIAALFFIIGARYFESFHCGTRHGTFVDDPTKPWPSHDVILIPDIPPKEKK